MKAIFLSTALSLFTGGGSSITSALRSEVQKALRYGSVTSPNYWNFNGEFTPYGQSVQYLNNQQGPAIFGKYTSGGTAIFSSNIEDIDSHVMMSSGDYFKFTSISIGHRSGNTFVEYAQKYVDLTLGYGDSFYITHAISTTQGNSTDDASDQAVAEALTTGFCLPITQMKYTRSDTGNTLHTATNFDWGSYYTEFQAVGESSYLSSGSPNSIVMTNQYNAVYATRTLSGSHTLGNRVNFKFDVNVS